MAPHQIRQYGDPVLKEPAAPITDIDGALVKLADDMIETMYEAPGVGLAAPQIGVKKRLFVYDIGDGPRTIINPEIVESDGEWPYEEGCLSIQGLSFELIRPNHVHLVGVDLDGNEVSIEASELEGRCFQHELDHLNGVLFVDRLDGDQRKQARKALRELMLGRPGVGTGVGGPGGASSGLSL
jgi:peptide deformylase